MNCNHEWYVFSTELSHVCLMVECRNCGAFGMVDDPSKEEWGDAFHAPSNPGDGPKQQRRLSTIKAGSNGFIKRNRIN